MRAAPAWSRSGQAVVLRALIFDSEYDRFRGVIAFVRIVDGRLAPGDRIRLHATGQTFDVLEVGVMRLGRVPTPTLDVGEVGYVIAGVKNVHDVRVGDTIMSAERTTVDPLPGYQPMTPMVFSGLYPIESADYALLRDALEKLTAGQPHDVSPGLLAEIMKVLGASR